METPHTFDDATLVARARLGDGDAFAALYSRHVGAVERVIAAHTRDREVQRELVQDVFLRAFTRLGTLREPERLRFWLLAAARNSAIDERRRRGRHPVESLDVDTAPEVVATGPAPSDVVVWREAAARVRAQAARLSPRDATVLTMAGHGWEPAEMAPALGVTPNCAKVVLHRARRRLLALEVA